MGETHPIWVIRSNQRAGGAAGGSRAREFLREFGVLTAISMALLASAPATADTPAAADETLGRHAAETYAADLESVLERRFLRVLTSNNSFDFYIYQGRRAGYQYEMVRAFTQYLNKKYRKNRKALAIQFELLPVRSDELIPMLRSGRADLIAARLTITPDRATRVRFSKPYRRVDELLVAHRDAPAITTLADLSGRAVAVRPSSSHYQSLQRVNERLRSEGRAEIRIVTVDEALETESILALVAEGHFDYTVADSMVAETAAAVFPGLRVESDVRLREDAQLAWATLPSASALADEMNAFLERYRHGSLLGNVGVKRYFDNHRGLRRRLSGGAPNGLSEYDAYLRKFAGEYGFDWRLLAAVAYQESRFDQTAHNRWGATGLFQLKPSTAREPYIGIPEIAGEKNAENNVHAGARYLAWIKQRYFDPIEGMRERDRIRMSLAAYNAGPRTLINARRRAERMGLDPTRWFRNVEMALLAMNRSEPVKYVSEINQRYLSYVLLGIE